MMMDLILEVILAFVVLGITTICAAPIVFYMAPRARWPTRMSLSFVLGFTLITLAGLFSAYFGVNPIILQCCVVLAGFGLFLCKWLKIAGDGEKRLDREDWIALAFTSLYLFVCLFFVDRIIIWRGGDALAHAEIIRMLLDGRSVPVSIPPLGSYWEYYPKGFHFFCYPWAIVFPILDVLRTIPILITAITTLLLYLIVRELGRREEAIYALILASFVFSTNYSNLIWAGYPTITAEMLLVAALLSVLVEKRLLPILLLGLLFCHARLLAITCGVLLLWMAVTRLCRYRYIIWGGWAAKIVVASAAVGIAAALAHSAHSPQFLVSVFTNRTLAGDYALRWYPSFLSLFGAVIAFLRRDRVDLLALSWAGAVAIIIFLADVGPLEFVGTADRLLLELYLPLSLLAASAVSKMEGSMNDGAMKNGAGLRARAGFMLILILCGFLAMVGIFHSFAASWGLPEEDYRAIEWLGKQNYSDAVCINLDETGAWVYPLTGIRVTNPRMGTGEVHLVEGSPFDLGLVSKIIADPGSPELTDALCSLRQARYLIYISSVSVSRPGYVPPFAEYSQTYPVVNLSYPMDRYELIYHNGTYIFGFPRRAFS
jgi:hypothetical protein